MVSRKIMEWNLKNILRSISCIALVPILLLAGCQKQISDVEYVQRAKDYIDIGDSRSATLELKSALLGNSENIEARWLLGQLYFSMGFYAAAEKELQMAVKLGMSDPPLMVLLAKSLLH